jgi:hypothetical protein
MARTTYTKENFIEKARAAHGDRYGYEKVEYKDYKTKVLITCYEHGDFWQLPGNHACLKNGCPLCGRNSTNTCIRRQATWWFINGSCNVGLLKERLMLIHGERYAYDNVVGEVSVGSKINVMCKKHGEFSITASKHLSGQGCKRCAYDRFSYGWVAGDANRQKFINKAVLVHGNRYSYDKLCYTGMGNKVTISCPVHGDFTQQAASHVGGGGVPTLFWYDKKGGDTRC